nr:uncharacterized protein LOC109167503 [Ipomoea batatas]
MATNETVPPSSNTSPSDRPSSSTAPSLPPSHTHDKDGPEPNSLSLEGLDLGFDDETDAVDDFRFTLVGRIMTEKIVKFTFMRDTMASVWRPRYGIAAKDLQNNTFLFQFFHELDMQRALEDGPWSFEQNLLVLSKIHPGMPPASMPLDTTEFWVKIHDLPLGFFSKKYAKAIGNFIGAYVCSDDAAFNGWLKSFIRIRVRVNILKPLVGQMRIRRNGGDWSWITFRYERLPISVSFVDSSGIQRGFVSNSGKAQNYPMKNSLGHGFVLLVGVRHRVVPMDHEASNPNSDGLTPDGLTILDTKRKRSESFIEPPGPFVEPTSSLIDLNGPVNSKQFGSGARISLVTSSGVWTTGVGVWNL